MARLLTIFAVASCGTAAQVNWYMPRAPGEQTLQWLTSAAQAIDSSGSSSAVSVATGVYLCCGGFSFLSNGTFVSLGASTVHNETQPLLDASLDVFYVLSISNISIATGSWASGIAAAVQSIDAGGFDGYVVDYEPATNYTAQHAQAYATFLQALATALHEQGKQLGFCSAGWGILDYWQYYQTTGVDIATSMTPTYGYTGDGSHMRAFVSGQITGGMPLHAIAAGIGTMLTSQHKPEWPYNWTQPTLTDFAGWLGQQGVQRLDFWRADIDKAYPPSDTQQWEFEVAADFIKGR